MANLKKVMLREKANDLTDEEKEKIAQKEYEEKVKGLLECCKKFDKYLHETANDSDRWHLKFKEIFKDYLESKKLFSRTRSVLKDIYKNFQWYTVKEYPLIKGIWTHNGAEAFSKYHFPKLSFKPKKPDDGGYIKRSAIDDPEVAKYFNEQLPKSLYNAYDSQLQKDTYLWGYMHLNDPKGPRNNVYVSKRPDAPYGYEKEVYNVGKSELSDPFINSKKVIIPSGVTEIPKYSFENFRQMEELVIPYGVKEIGEYAFSGCINLKSVVFKSSPFVDMFAFSRCFDLREITFLNVVPSFDVRAFGHLWKPLTTTIKVKKQSDIRAANKALSKAFGKYDGNRLAIFEVI